MRPRLLAVQGGFTLLEVLLVVVLIGIISGIAMLGLSAGSDERRLRNESDRLAAMLVQVGSEAVMQNQEYGLKIRDNAYLFLCLDEVKQRWLACSADSTLQERSMPEGMEIHILRDSTLKLALGEDDEKSEGSGKDDNNAEGPRIYPDILLLSSGEASPASLEILVTDHPEIRTEIHIDELGRVNRDGDETESSAADKPDDERA